MKLLRTIQLASVLLLLAGTPQVALGKPPTGPSPAVQADKLNDAAKQAFRDGQFDLAADLFMQVYDLSKTPAAVFNAARAREQAQKLEEARALFELYLKIEKTPAGLADAQAHITAIVQARAAQAEADRLARQKAEEAAKAAEAAAQKAQADARELERRELERLRVEKARLEAEKLRADQEKARLEALRSSTDGVTILPPGGTTGEETEKVAREVQQALAHEVELAGVGKLHPLAEYAQAEQNRGMAGLCDFRCRLDVARNLGSAYAVTTTLRSEARTLHVRLVLWRTSDASEMAATEVEAVTLTGLTQRGQRVAGDLFNGIRKFLPLPLAGTPTDQLLLTTEPPTCAVTLDEQDLGQTPLHLRLTPGLHRLRVQKAGFHPRAGTVTLTGMSAKLNVILPSQLPAEIAPEPAPTAPPAAAPVPIPVPAKPPSASGAPKMAPPSVPAVAPAAAPPSAPPAEEKSAEKDRAAAMATVVDADRAGGGSKDKKGFVWGLVFFGEGGAAVMKDSTDSLTADLNWGAGTFVHMSREEEGAPPVASWILGGRYVRFAGLITPADVPAATPIGASIFTGVVFPRFTGLAGTLHYNYVTVKSGQPAFSYLTAQARIMGAKEVFYYALGVEFMLHSFRPQAEYDNVGAGPSVRLSLELGLNLGGTPLSK